MKITSLRIVAVALALTAAAVAQAEPLPTSTDEARAHAAPARAADHAALARQYQQDAERYRLEARYHRRMAADTILVPSDLQDAAASAEAEKMQAHCEAIVRNAERAAADAEWSARYHGELARAAEAAPIRADHP